MAATESADHKIREKWKQGDTVQLFSRPISSSGELLEKKWQKGKIVEIFNDSEGEWLTIKYCGIRTKQVQRFADDVIRPMPKKAKKKKISSLEVPSSSIKKRKAVTPDPGERTSDSKPSAKKKKKKVSSLKSIKSDGAVPAKKKKKKSVETSVGSVSSVKSTRSSVKSVKSVKAIKVSPPSTSSKPTKSSKSTKSTKSSKSSKSSSTKATSPRSKKLVKSPSGLHFAIEPPLNGRARKKMKKGATLSVPKNGKSLKLSVSKSSTKSHSMSPSPGITISDDHGEDQLLRQMQVQSEMDRMARQIDVDQALKAKERRQMEDQQKMLDQLEQIKEEIAAAKQRSEREEAERESKHKVVAEERERAQKENERLQAEIAKLRTADEERERERVEKEEALKERAKMKAELEAFRARLEAVEALKEEERDRARIAMERAKEEEDRRKQIEAEKEREIERLRVEEEERKRREAEELAARKAAEDELKRLKEEMEAERVRKEKEEAEAERKRMEEEERRRIAEEMKKEEMKRLEAEKESLRIKAEQEQCIRLRMAMDLEQSAFDQVETQRFDALRVHEKNAHHIVDVGCTEMDGVNELEIAGTEDRHRLLMNLEFIDEMITRCDRAQEVEWIEQDTDTDEVPVDGDDFHSQSESEEEEDTDSEEPSDSEHGDLTHCDNGNCGRPLIVRKVSSCYQCGDRIVLNQKCVYCPRCDDVQVFLCAECEAVDDGEEHGTDSESTVYSVDESDDMESEEEYEDSDSESDSASTGTPETDGPRQCECADAEYDEITAECLECGKHWYVPGGPSFAVYDIKQHEKCAICHGQNDEEWEEQEALQKAVESLSRWENRAKELYDTKLVDILEDVEVYADFERLSENEQEMIMQVICCLTEMRSICLEYSENYCKQNQWARRLLTVYDGLVAMFAQMEEEED